MLNLFVERLLSLAIDAIIQQGFTLLIYLFSVCVTIIREVIVTTYTYVKRCCCRRNRSFRKDVPTQTLTSSAQAPRMDVSRVVKRNR